MCGTSKLSPDRSSWLWFLSLSVLVMLQCMILTLTLSDLVCGDWILVMIYHYLLFSVCCVCCCCHFSGTDFHQHLSEESGLQCPPASIPHHSLHHSGKWSIAFPSAKLNLGQGMLLMCPFFDDLNALSTYKYTTPCVIRIVISCVFALGVNISNYLVLGKTSPLTYQVTLSLCQIRIVIRIVL